jgi:hypothetical protein
MRRHLVMPAAFALVILTACLDPDPVPESNYGLIGLTTVITESDTILSPEAIFWRTGPLGLPTSRINTDQCLVAPYPSDDAGQGAARFLDAGDSVAVSTGTATRYLFPRIEIDRELYQMRQDDTLQFRPGETVTVTVPGAPGGFANGTISVATARPFALGPINPSPPEGQDLDLTWTPAGDDSTKILISLQYGLGGFQANRQIFCELVDDGVYKVPAILLTEWRSATTGSRSVKADRWRVALRQVTDGVLILISAFEVEGPVD